MIKKFWIICAAMVAISSCTKDSDTELTDSELLEGGRTITATLTMPQSEDNSTKVETDYGESNIEGDDTWYFTWESDDFIYAINDTDTPCKLENLSISTDSLTATFSGTVDKYWTSCYLLYAKGGMPTRNEDGDGYDIDISTNQTGDSDQLLMVSYEDDIENSNIGSNLYHVGAFMVLDIDFSNIPPHWRNVYIKSITYTGMNTKYNNIPVADMLDDDAASVYASKDDITIDIDMYDENDEDADKKLVSDYVTNNLKLRLNILPTTLTSTDSIGISISFSNGTTYNSVSQPITTDNDTLTLERAKFYTTSVDCDFSTKELTYTFANGDFAENTYTYEINTAEHLAALAALTNAGKLNGTSGTYTFELTNDINAKSTYTTSEFTPIGYYYLTTYSSTLSEETVVSFEGTFNGNGHSISYDLEIGSGDAFITGGLFGYVNGTSTTIKNLLIESSKSTMNRSGTHASLLAATLQDGATILNCGCDSSSSLYSVRGAVGGLVGYANDNTYIYNSYNQGSVTGANNDEGTSFTNVGGLCGATFGVDGSTGVTINNCYNSGTVYYDELSTNIMYIRIGALIGLIDSHDTCSNLYYDSKFVTKIEANDDTTSDDATYLDKDNKISDTSLYSYILCNNSYGGGTAPWDDDPTPEDGSTPEDNYITSMTTDSMKMSNFVTTLNSKLPSDAVNWKVVTDGYPTLLFTETEQ